MWQFILFRGIQGLAGGAVFPLAFAVLADLYTPAERGKYAGLFGAVFGLSSILGPAIGGILTDNLGWHWIFFINVPIGLVSLYVVYRLLPGDQASRGGAQHRLRRRGTVHGCHRSVPRWAHQSRQCRLVGSVGRRPDARRRSCSAPSSCGGRAAAPDPIIPLHLFRNRTFTISVTAMFLATFGFFSAVVFLPRWFQVVAGSSATEAGYQLLPLLGALIVSATLSGQIVARTHRYKLLIVGSLVLLAVGLYLLTNLHANTDRPVLWIWMVVAGLGIGPSFAVFALIVQNAVSMARDGNGIEQPHLLPTDRRNGGTHDRQHHLRQPVDRGDPDPARRCRCPRAGRSEFKNQGTFDLTGIGDRLGDAILAGVPEQFRQFVEPSSVRDRHGHPRVVLAGPGRR